MKINKQLWNRVYRKSRLCHHQVPGIHTLDPRQALGVSCRGGLPGVTEIKEILLKDYLKFLNSGPYRYYLMIYHIEQ